MRPLRPCGPCPAHALSAPPGASQPWRSRPSGRRSRPASRSRSARPAPRFLDRRNERGPRRQSPHAKLAPAPQSGSRAVAQGNAGPDPHVPRPGRPASRRPVSPALRLGRRFRRPDALAGTPWIHRGDAPLGLGPLARSRVASAPARRRVLRRRIPKRRALGVPDAARAELAWRAQSRSQEPATSAAESARGKFAGSSPAAGRSTRIALSHPDLPSIDTRQLTREVAGSRRELRRLFDIPVDFFCYPGGRYDATASSRPCEKQGSWRRRRRSRVSPLRLHPSSSSASASVGRRGHGFRRQSPWSRGSEGLSPPGTLAGGETAVGGRFAAERKVGAWLPRAPTPQAAHGVASFSSA